MTLKKFAEEYGERCENSNYDVEEVYNEYHSKVKPYLNVIATFRIGDVRATQKQIAKSLHVSVPKLRIMKEAFEELGEAIDGYENLMALEMQLAIAKGIQATEYKNAKMIEMGAMRWDEGYKPKGDTVEIDLPDKIVFEVVDAGVTEEELITEYDEEFKR